MTRMQKKKQTAIVLDLDDTLVDTSAVFTTLSHEFNALMVSQSFSSNETMRIYEQIQERNLKLLGYVSERNLISMRETYEILALANGHQFSSSTLKQIARIGSNCLYRVPSIMPHARSFLKWCSQQYRLALLTRGSEGLQGAKLEKLGFSKYFESVKIVSNKTEDAFRELLTALQCDPADAVSIGDSLRFDVLPSASIGMRAIHIPYSISEMQWKHDFAPESEMQGVSYKTALNLLEAKKLLQEMIA